MQMTVTARAQMTGDELHALYAPALEAGLTRPATPRDLSADSTHCMLIQTGRRRGPARRRKQHSARRRAGLGAATDPPGLTSGPPCAMVGEDRTGGND